LQKSKTIKIITRESEKLYNTMKIKRNKILGLIVEYGRREIYYDGNKRLFSKQKNENLEKVKSNSNTLCSPF
jgi:hypothetical protein